MTQNNLSCLIPFYNEGDRIIPVLNIVTKLSSISEVICIDDGSTDNASELVRNVFPKVILISLKKNNGKKFAIEKGLSASSNETILLMDADLENLQKFEIKNAIEMMMMQDKNIDMLILRRMNAPWLIRINRIDILFSGERILKKKDLKIILKEKIKGYQLEIAINSYMQKNNKNVCWMPSSARNTFKIKKNGFLSGLSKDGSMYADIIAYDGWINYFRQVMHFARKEGSKLNGEW